MPRAQQNADLAARAERVIPGGVNSSNRRLAWPLAVVEASGAYFTDADGTRYLDYHAAFGPLILGHNHPQVDAAVREVIGRLDIIGAGVTDMEVQLAETIVQYVPSAERVLLANSGSEATYAALRLARAVTGRNTIIKFQGTYHGWHDAVLMNVISPADKIGQKDPLSLGMLPEVVDHLPACNIRPDCRWFRQEGRAACVRCPQIVTGTHDADETLRKVAGVPKLS